MPGHWREGSYRSTASCHQRRDGGAVDGGIARGFNARAFESYGHDEEQGLNAPVSERVTFAYTTALNYLLSDRNHHIRLGDTTIVYWADSDDEDCAALFSQAINPNFGERAEGEDDPDEKLDAIMGALAADGRWKAQSSMRHSTC